MTTLALPSRLGPVIAAFRGWMDSIPFLPTRQGARGHHRTGHVSLVGAGPGSADLITLRGLQRLQAADVIFYDRLADPALLDHAPGTARRVYVGKAPGCHAMPQTEINRLLVQSARRGLAVVRLKCGDPGIFGRGAEEAAACDAAGVSWDVVPGVTAACAAAAAARSFLTERGQTERLVLATGHLRQDGVQDWSASAAPGTTLACYMGVSQAGPIMAGLLAAGWPERSPVQVISKAQTAAQVVMACPLSNLAELCAGHPGLNPAILLIRWPHGAQATGPQHMARQGMSAT
jgi:uroporphyrin-III C-methyltransferase